MKYILSAFSDEAGSTIDEQINICTKNGINFFELRSVDNKNITEMTIGEIKEIKKKLDENGIKVSALGSPFGKINIEDDFKPHLEKYKKTIEFAHILGTENIRIFSFYFSQNQKRMEYADKVFEQLNKFVEFSNGINVCHENEKGIFGENIECNEMIAKEFDGKIKLVFDPANYIQSGVDALEAYSRLKYHIIYFHIKDAQKLNGNVVPAGKGDAEILRILKDFTKTMTGNNCFLSLEPHLEIGNTYKTKEIAFETASSAIKKILCEIG